MTTARDMSWEVDMACRVVIVRWQEVLQFTVMRIQASATAADCAMKVNLKTIHIIAVTTFVFFAKDNALFTAAAVHVILAVIVANPRRGLWGRWWSRRRRWGSVQVEGGEGGHLRPPQGHHPAPSWGRGGREKVVEWATGRKMGRRFYLSQGSLAGGCPLVTTGSRCCATVTAASTTSCLVTRSWWRGWSSCCRIRRRRLKCELDNRLASLGWENQVGRAAILLHFTVERQEFCDLSLHFFVRDLNKSIWAGAPAKTSFHFHCQLSTSTSGGSV